MNDNRTKINRQEPDYPRALQPPSTPTSVISTAILTEAMEASRQSPRGRVILPFHKNSSDVLQRMLNALQPESYIQPHRHMSPPKAESILVLRGSICTITFSEDGETDQIFFLSADSSDFGIDTDAGVYHTFFALEADTVLFEVKPGPYGQETDKQFAPWSPEEGTPEATAYFLKLQQLATAANRNSVR